MSAAMSSDKELHSWIICSSDQQQWAHDLDPDNRDCIVGLHAPRAKGFTTAVAVAHFPTIFVKRETRVKGKV